MNIIIKHFWLQLGITLTERSTTALLRLHWCIPCVFVREHVCCRLWMGTVRWGQ